MNRRGHADRRGSPRDAGGWHPVEAMLRRRGLALVSPPPRERVLLPPGGDEERFYRAMGHYAFRLFLRDCLAHPDPVDPERTARYPGPAAARRYRDLCRELGILCEAPGGGLRVRPRAAPDFGPTLEWYLAEVLHRQFACPALWSVRLAKTLDPLPHPGGDFDCLFELEGKLAYAEVKSSPPGHLEGAEVESFLERVEALGPALALFVEDTHLRMKDKIVPLFARALGREPRRLEREIFTVEDRLFILNSRPQLHLNLARCLARFLREAPPGAWPQGRGPAGADPVGRPGDPGSLRIR